VTRHTNKTIVLFYYENCCVNGSAMRTIDTNLAMISPTPSVCVSLSFQQSQQNSPGWSSVPPFSRSSGGGSTGGPRTTASTLDQDTTTSESSSSDSEDGAQRVQCSPS
jgi:hypothetical protein